MKKGKKRIWLIIVILLAATFFSMAAFLHSKEYLTGENPISGMNKERSHIPVTGKNYAFNYKQEEEYQQEKKEKKEQIRKEQKQAEPMEEVKETESETASPLQESQKNEEESENLYGNGTGGTTPGTGTEGGTSSGGGSGNGEENGGENTGGEDEESKLPRITCSLTEGQQVSGMFLGFTVKAVSYKNIQLDAFYLTVTVNGNKLYSSGNQNGEISYRTSQELQDGTNEVVITAVDKEGYTAVKMYHVVVNAEEAKKEGGTMVVRLGADVLGLGSIFSENVTFYEGENLPYVIDRAFKQAGVTYRHTGTFDYGFYLQRVERPGVTNGYQIPNAILQKLEEENCSWVGYETDSIGEKDFYYWSGWVYRMDGYFPGGLSTVPAEDGSVIELLFTLNNGAEYNGTWFSGNW